MPGALPPSELLFCPVTLAPFLRLSRSPSFSSSLLGPPLLLSLPAAPHPLPFWCRRLSAAHRASGDGAAGGEAAVGAGGGSAALPGSPGGRAAPEGRRGGRPGAPGAGGRGPAPTQRSRSEQVRLGGLLGHARPSRRALAIWGGRGRAGGSGPDLDPGVSARAIAREGPGPASRGGRAGCPGAWPQCRAASAAPGHCGERSRAAGSPRAGSGERGGLPGKGGGAVRRADPGSPAPGPPGLGSAPSWRCLLAHPRSPSRSRLGGQGARPRGRRGAATAHPCAARGACGQRPGLTVSL